MAIFRSKIAKATFVKTMNHRNVFWMPSDLKWHKYQSELTVKTFHEFADLVDKDEHYCFWE